MTLQLEDDRLAIAALVVLLAMLGAMLAGGTVGQILFSYTIIAFIGIYVLFGVKSTAESRGWRPFLVTVAVTVGILSAVFGALWYFHHLNPSYTDPVYWLGFPRATAIVVYALWMPPALVLMFSYPYLFDEYIWSSTQAEEFAEKERTRTGTGVPGGED
jgi:hypothetical protein